jgi:hypothetical protein
MLELEHKVMQELNSAELKVPNFQW